MSNPYSIDNIINEFSTAIANTDDPTGGVTYKLLQIWQGPLDDIQNKIQQLRDFNDINNESGGILDDEGRNTGLQRDGDDDDFFRFRINTQRLQRSSNGTLPFLYKFVSQALGCDPSEFQIISLYDSTGNANRIKIENVPAKYLNNRRKAKILLDAVQGAVAEGIIVEDIDYQQFANTQLYTGVSYSIEHETTVKTERS